jgi:hypothetical protein
MKNKDFDRLFRFRTHAFLDEYLTSQCSRSLHTVKACRDTFTVFRQLFSMYTKLQMFRRLYIFHSKAYTYPDMI